MIGDADAGTSRQTTIMLVALALMAVGVVMVASSTASLDRSLFDPGWWRTPFGRQLIFVAAGAPLMLLTSRAAVFALESPLMRRRVPAVLLIVTAGLLVAALLPGVGEAHRGSHRWLRFAPGGFDVGVQPSELAKLALVAIVAYLLTRPDADPRSLRASFIPASLAIGLCVLLVGAEDFGTSALLLGTGVGMLFVAGCRLRHLAALGAIGAFALTGLLLMAPYRMARLTAYADIWADPQGAGYQPLQSLAGIASGGWFGVGLGGGIQKYGYLPEGHTDFIFAVICEETGVFGACLVIALFGALLWLGLRTTLTARGRFERLLAFGLTTTMILQAVMNIAVVTVVTPTTGISLPLVSAGGSGIVTYCVAVGILAAIATRGDDRRVAGPATQDSAKHLHAHAKHGEAPAW
ncbi:MAG: putative peptidoglycan glycosyltransferase FtsW [Phycisphaerae bacterium]